MKILYVLNSGNPGGMEFHVLDLVKGLVSRGHEVFVWCAPGPMSDLYQSGGAHVVEKKIKTDLDPRYFIQISKFIKNNAINIVHAHELKACVNAAIGARLAGVKSIITHIHTPMSEWKAGNPVKRMFIRLESYFYSIFVNIFSDMEIALTSSRKEVKIKEGIMANKLVVIPNGVELAKFDLDAGTRQLYRREITSKHNIPQDAIILGNVGRLTQEKGHLLAIESFAKVLGNYKGESPLWLFFAGGGELEVEVRELAKKLNVEKNVVITGIFEQKEVVKFYSTFDVFIFPSFAEGFGLVFVEAMSSSLPCIVSDLEVLKEVGSPRVVYFQKGSAEDLAAKILEMLNLSVQARRESGNHLRDEVAGRYEMSKFVDNYISLYESLISR